MRKYLLSQSGNFYKANLHSHTTVSDGRLTPEEMKKAYIEKGYSIVAYTDHYVLIPHNDLTDENFLALNGIEHMVEEGFDSPEVEAGLRERRVCHICFISLDENNVTQPCYHRTRHLMKKQEEMGLRDIIVHDESKPDFERVYSTENINEAIKEARESGFFVTYNHPRWSFETYEQYSKYEGMNAFEMYNHSGDVKGFDEYSPFVYDDLLRQNKRIFCIFADDGHFVSRSCSEHPKYDLFGGWVMIKADRLDYKSVAASLSQGNFYSSQGPEIHELYYEDGNLVVKTSPAASINFTTGRRVCSKYWAEEGSYIQEASFPVKDNYFYVRVTVEDEYGRRANSNAYFVDELMKE